MHPSAVFFAKANTKLHVDNPDRPPSDRTFDVKLFKLWVSYGTAVFAGLMIIGHASGVVRVLTGDASLVLVAMLNMAGCLLAGALADQIPATGLLVALPILSLLSLLALTVTGSAYVTLAGLACIGFAYGAMISVYPLAVSNVYGPVAGVRAYGRVFTAWGLAGIAGPVTAGALYSGFGNYQLALAFAAALCLVSTLVMRQLAATR